MFFLPLEVYLDNFVSKIRIFTYLAKIKIKVLIFQVSMFSYLEGSKVKVKIFQYKNFINFSYNRMRSLE